VRPIPLPLDEPRWAGLRDTYGPADAIPALLRALERGDDRVHGDEVWEPIWTALYHQGSVYSASYAAAAHVAAIGATRPISEQPPFWHFVGAIAGARDPAPVEFDLEAAYHLAVEVARAGIPACLAAGCSDETATGLAMSFAELQGERAIAVAINGLINEELSSECGGCGAGLLVTTSRVPFEVHAQEPERQPAAPGHRVRPRPPRAALAELAALARTSGHAALADHLIALDATVSCPACGVEHSLVDDFA